jgi:hypothetical protein
MSIIQGAVYQATYNAPSGSLSGSTAVLTVTAPDQITITTPTVTVTGGTATASVPGLQVGQYLLVWVVTGTAPDASQDQFSVVAAALDLVDLADIKQDLRIAATDTTYDVQLRRWIKAATGVATIVMGPVTPTTETYTIDGGNGFFVLPRRWITSITSLVEVISTTVFTLTEQPLGSSVNNYGYTWDRFTNKVVRRGGSGNIQNFPDGADNVICVYVAGMTVIPEDVQLGANFLVRHFFKKGDVPVKSLLKPADPSEGVPVGNYLVPREVMDVWQPYVLTPGIY